MLQFHNYLQIISFAVALILMQRSWPVAYKVLIAITGISVIVELTGWYIGTKLHQNNNWIYNIYVPVLGILQTIIFMQIVETKAIRNSMKLLMAVFLLSVAVSYFFFPHFFKLNSYALTIYLICSVISVALYFIDSMINLIDIPLVKQPGFWLGIGILIMSVLNIARFSFWNMIARTADYSKILNYIVDISNLSLYGAYIATFICLRINQKYYLH